MLIAVMLVCSLLGNPIAAVTQDQASDKDAVIKACLDYFEGWYEGDGARMERALSPELAKRAVAPLPNGRDTLRYSPYIMMIEVTKAGLGKKPLAEQNIKVEVFDIDGNIASAKATCNEFHDLIHLAKMNGEWKIVNVLWRPAAPPKR